jgi:TetR/AcrR family transcriptional regulator, transcriptional repressor of aconitase
MPRVSAQHGQARRDQIIAAAANCFARNGFAATSIPDIVAEAGLSVGSLYRYFSGKEDLFLAVVAERAAVHNDAVFAELDRAGAALGRVRTSLRRLQRLLDSQLPDDARLLLELWARAHDMPALGEWLRQARARRVQAFRRVIEEAKLAGEARRDLRASDAATVLVALADGLVVQRACVPFQEAAGDPLKEAERLIASWEREPG